MKWSLLAFQELLYLEDLSLKSDFLSSHCAVHCLGVFQLLKLLV